MSTAFHSQTAEGRKGGGHGRAEGESAGETEERRVPQAADESSAAKLRAQGPLPPGAAVCVVPRACRKDGAGWRGSAFPPFLQPDHRQLVLCWSQAKPSVGHFSGAQRHPQKDLMSQLPPGV